MSATAVDESPLTGRLKPWQLRLYSALIPVCIAGFTWGLFGIHLYTGKSFHPCPWCLLSPFLVCEDTLSRQTFLDMLF